jgi:signal transduction histidine kinase
LKYRAAETILELEEGVASDPSLRVSGVQARAARAESVPPVSLAAAALPLISIGSPADPTLLEPTYAYLSAYTAFCFSPRVAERLNVAIYELYANALRYGTAAGEVRLEIERSGGGAVLRISNQVEPTQLERLTAQLARVQTDAGAAFAAEMNRFAGGSQPPPMLGLVRVSHESGLKLQLSQNGERIELSLVCEA